jgi:hypothetical protein
MGLGNILNVLDEDKEILGNRVLQANGLIYLDIVAELVGMGWTSIIDMNHTESILLKHMHELSIPDIYHAFYIQSKAIEKLNHETISKLYALL